MEGSANLVDVLLVAIVGAGWAFLLVPGVKFNGLGERKERDTETPTPSARQRQKFGKFAKAARVVAARGVCVVRSFLVRVCHALVSPVVINGKAFVVMPDCAGYGVVLEPMESEQ